jgi:hypothetical protein
MGQTDAVRIAFIAVAGAVALSSCATSHSDQPSGGPGSKSDLAVTVSTGIDSAQVDLQVVNRPVAMYFPDSGKVVFVSNALYSSTCTPQGKATQDGSIIALTVEDSDGNCTADAVRDTFQIDHITTAPMLLVIEQAGQPDLRLTLSSSH